MLEELNHIQTSMFKSLNSIINKKIVNHLAFWLVLYIYYLSSYWSVFSYKTALAERFVVKTSFQILLTYTTIYLFIPYLLNKNRKFLFVVSSLISVYIVYVSYSAYRHFYFDNKYPGFMRPFNFYERILDFNFYLSEITWFIFPAIILVALQYYKDQKEVIALREQKKITELNVLKNQLNPHFLFNTLNNLYSLSLKKSERAPEVIMKLSKILDYMLYQCNDNFVSLSGEVILLNNYIALEKVRYGKRLAISFNHSIENEVKIAPLLLLTFVENAFKHGVSQEIKVAKIDIILRATSEEIKFEIENTKPTHIEHTIRNKGNSIGLKNIKKQLNILYPDNYKLETIDSKKTYSVNLKLVPNAI